MLAKHKEAFNGSGNVVGKLEDMLKDYVNVFEQLRNLLNDYSTMFDELLNFFNNLMKKLLELFNDLLVILINYLNSIYEKLTENLKDVLRYFVKMMLTEKKVEKMLMGMIKNLIDDQLKKTSKKPFIDFKLALEYETKDVCDDDGEKYLAIFTNLSLNASYNKASSDGSEEEVI
ncbi:unnamed protein product [Meloidogyne enterolobii]